MTDNFEKKVAVDGPVVNAGELGSSTFSPGQALPAGPLGLGQRWTVARKREVVLRLLRDEPVQLLSRQLGVEIFRLEQWREKAIGGIDASLKLVRRGTPRSQSGPPRETNLCPRNRVRYNQICFREVASYFGNIKRVSIDLRVPQDPVIRNNLSAVELRIDQLETGDGTVVEFPVGGFETFSNPTDEHSFSQSFFLDGDAPEGFDASSVTALIGRVRLRIPTAIETLSLDATILGSSAGIGPTKVRLTGYRDGVAQIEIDGPRERLVQILATKAEDKPVAAIVQQIEQIEETGLWQVDLLLGDEPSEFIVRVATEQDIIETPFRINLEP